MCLKRGLKLVVENPYSSDHYLVQFFPIKSLLIDFDRSQHGDYYKKPTQYWFINCQPSKSDKFEFGKNLRNYERKTIEYTTNRVERSMISPVYAKHFITRYLLNDKELI